MSVTKVLCVDDAAADLTMIQKIVSGANQQQDTDI